MIAFLHPVAIPASNYQAAFNEMLPTIVKFARYGLARLPALAQEEGLQDVLANCWLAFLRLAKRGKAEQAFPSALVRYAIRQHKTGRRVGSRLSACDALSQYAQFQRRFRVENLSRTDPVTGNLHEVFCEDHKTCVADQAAFRIDFPAWLLTMSDRNRQIVEVLAMGYSTGEVAEQFQLSSARISRLRRELNQSWHEFHGEGENAQAN